MPRWALLLSVLAGLCQSVHGAVQATPAQLHHLVCLAAAQAMLQAEPQAEGALQRELRDLPPAPRAAVAAALATFPSIREAVQSERPLTAKQLDGIGLTLTTSLAALQSVDSAPVKPGALDDLPERLDFALVLYVSHSQIGMLRPARESQGSYLGDDLLVLARTIDIDLAATTLPASASPEQQRQLSDAQQRWSYIAKPLLDYRRQAPAPLNVEVQVRVIGDDLRSVRASVRG